MVPIDGTVERYEFAETGIFVKIRADAAVSHYIGVAFLNEDGHLLRAPRLRIVSIYDHYQEQGRLVRAEIVIDDPSQLPTRLPLPYQRVRFLR